MLALLPALALAADPAPSLHPVVDDALARLQAHPEDLEAALRRMDEAEPVVLSALRRHGVPDTLAALPLVESGYENLPSSANPVGAAGVWQFVPQTARRYGLRVNDQVDERLNLVLASDAAARLLADQHDAFGDWGLAIAAYNLGAPAVRDAIEDGGTRDPLALVQLGDLPPYVAQVYAAMIVSE